MPNSSGARERFTLAAGQAKIFQNMFWPDQPVGYANLIALEIDGLVDQTPAGVPIDDGGTTVTMATSETNNGSDWVGVTSSVVKAQGKLTASGKVGAFFQIKNTGTGFATVVVSPASGMLQLVPGL